MKKKKIETVPYLELKSTVKDKEVLFVGVTAVKKVEKEMVLFLEVYKNSAEDKNIPVIRYVANKKDWAIFDTRYNAWTRRKMNSYDWGNGFVWYEDAQPQGRGYNERATANVLASKEDESRIRRFFKNVISYVNVLVRGQWYDVFDSFENNCVSKRKQSAYDRRRMRLRERTEAIPPLNEEALMRYSDEKLFSQKHFIYYTKRGSRARLACTNCQNVTEGRWRAGETYESQFEGYVPEPSQGARGECPVCGAVGVFKTAGRQKGPVTMDMHLYVISRYKDTGVCIRYVEVSKRFSMSTSEGKLTGAKEESGVNEIARTFVYNGKTQTDFHKHNPYIGGDFWDDCNLYGMANICVGEAPVYPESWKELKGTCMQYSAAKEYCLYKGEINFRDYAEKYIQYPCIEMLVKMKLFDIIGHMSLLDIQEKTPEGILRINRSRLRYLSEKRGDTAIWAVLRLEKRLGINWPLEQIEKLAFLNILNTNSLENTLRVISLQKFLNYISAYAGCEYLSCGNGRNMLMHVATEYMDYLSLRQQLGYDLTNTVYLHPRNLSEAHQKMVDEADRKGLDKKIAEVNQKYAHIKKEYRKLRRKYYFENDEYIIRPARDAGEIVREGRILHHCVGGDNYLSSHNEDRSYILFLRFKKKADNPYITIEISADSEKIRQWYGAYDKKPDEKNMQRLIDRYIEKLKEQTA